MSVLGRIGDLLKANVNEMIDKAEDPVKMARQVIRELDNEILALRSRIRANQTNEKRLARLMAALQEEVTTWQMRAEKAVDEDNDAMARQALRLRREKETEHKEAEATWWNASQERKEMEANLQEMEDRAQATRRRKETLIRRERSGRNSSEFVPLPSHSEERVQSTFQTVEIDAELAALKQRRQGTDKE